MPAEWFDGNLMDEWACQSLPRSKERKVQWQLLELESWTGGDGYHTWLVVLTTPNEQRTIKARVDVQTALADGWEPIGGKPDRFYLFRRPWNASEPPLYPEKPK